MLNTTTLDTVDACFGAACSLEQHQRYHRAIHCALLNLLDHCSGLAVPGDLHTVLGQPTSNADAVATTLRDIRQDLLGLAPSDFDRIGHDRRLPLFRMTRWHRARVNAFLARYHDAG